MKYLIIAISLFSVLSTPFAQAKEENKSLTPREIVDGYYSLWNEQKIDGLERYIAEDISFKDYAFQVELDSRAALGEFMQSVFSASSEMTFTILRFIDKPPYAVTQWKFEGIDEASGKAYMVNGASVLKIVDGLIVENTDYFDEENISKQLQ